MNPPLSPYTSRMANDTELLLAAINSFRADMFERLDRFDARMSGSDAPMDRLDAPMDRSEAHMDVLLAELSAARSGLMDRMDRIQDALTDLKDDLTVTHATIERVERDTATAREEIEGMRSIARGVRADLGTLNTQILALARKSRRADERLGKLEAKAA